MKQPYSLDFSIVRDTDRTSAIYEILDKLEKDPSQTELEQMASYILYGKDENGQNAIQRNETIDKNKRYKSYKTKDDYVESLDEILEQPGFNEEQVRSAYKRDAYKVYKPNIEKPKYDKKTGEMIDPGDSDIPGMREQWEIIDRWQRMLDVAQGKVPPAEGDTLVTDPYRIYQLKHNLIDIRKHQYYLKDSYKPTLHFQKLDHPKPQFYDWSADMFYWITYDEWKKRTEKTYTHTISQDLKDYETKEEGGILMVKWVICRHTFDWENPLHVRALLTHYHTLYEAMHEKLNTYGCTLLWDFDRYVKLCEFTELRLYLIELRKQGLQYEEIAEEMQQTYDFVYSMNYLASVFSSEIPNKIARVAKIQRLLVETPQEERKKCGQCGQYLPRHPLFYSRNNARKDGYCTNCKECERKNRIRKGVIGNVDMRIKDPTLH